MPSIEFHNLAERHFGLTPALSESIAEAARVCLDRHHVPVVVFELSDQGVATKFDVDWIVADQRTQYAWRNKIDATEAGAYALALAGVEAVRGLVAVCRAETLTGSDYYLDVRGSDPEDLESCVRLEVSGVDAGNLSVIKGRLVQKVEQAENGTSNLPAVACVVGFRELKILMQNVETP